MEKTINLNFHVINVELQLKIAALQARKASIEKEYQALTNTMGREGSLYHVVVLH